MVKTPSTPPPAETAAAQAGLNRDTAITQQQLNMVDQIGPTGSLTYQQTGNQGFTGADGKWVNTPHYLQTTSLSPAQQGIFNQTQAAQGNLAGLAADQSGKLRSLLNTPFSYTNKDAEDYTFGLGSKRLTPKFAQDNDALRTRLVNSGLQEGSQGYDAAWHNQQEGQNDAWNQLALGSRQQGFTEALTQRNQPINEIAALMSGSQVSMPTFAQTPQTGVAGVDYSGLVQNKYQADSQKAAAGMGGLFGLLSAPFAFL